MQRPPAPQWPVIYLENRDLSKSRDNRLVVERKLMTCQEYRRSYLGKLTNGKHDILEDKTCLLFSFWVLCREMQCYTVLLEMLEKNTYTQVNIC